METSVFEEYLFGRAERGDLILVEYSPTYPVGEFFWGFLVPRLIERGGVVIGDFFGIGDMIFRNYTRKISGKEYSSLIELIKEIKVVKIGPGSASYGEVLEEITPTYESHGFLKNYHTIINRMTHSPAKPEYFVTFGLANYLNFGGKAAMKALLTSISTIPMEDWVGIHFINVDVLEKDQLAMLEEIASIVFYVSSEGVTVKKGGDVFDSGG